MERNRFTLQKTLLVLFALNTFITLRYDIQSHSYISTTNYAIASKIALPTTLQRPYETWGVYFRGAPVKKDFSFQREVVLANPIHGCSKLKNADKINGKIVLIDADDCDPQQKAKHATEAGAHGIIIVEYQWHPALTYLTDGKDHPELNVSTVQMFAKDFHELKKWIENGTVIELEMCPDPNPWDQTYGNRDLWDAHMAFVVTGFTIVLLLAFYKIYLYWKNREKARTKLAILVLVAIYSVVTTLGWVDAIGTLGIWSYRVSTLLSSAYFPFGLTTYFLLALYWGSIAKGVVPDFEKLKKPFMIITPFFFIAEFGSWAPRYLFINTELILSILLIMYVISFAVATIFYVKNGIQIIMILFAETTHPAASPQLKKITFYILTIATCNGLMVLMFIVYLIIGIGPVTNACIYWIHAALMIIIAFSEVQMFVEKKRPMELPMEKEMNVINFNMDATQSSTFDSSEMQ